TFLNTQGNDQIQEFKFKAQTLLSRQSGVRAYAAYIKDVEENIMIEDLFSTEARGFGSKQYPSTTPAFGRGFEIVVPYGKLIYIPQFIEKKVA
ncbi:hypothetical protein ABS241_19505, partial [Acinetobacter baumannii]